MTLTASRGRRLAVATVAALALLAAAPASAAVAAGSGNPHHANGKAPDAARRARPGRHAVPCSALPGGTSIPSAPPRNLAWRTVGAMLVPVSESSGPARFTTPAWTCWAHSPMGAVLAAYGISAALSGPDWEAAARTAIVPGPGQRAFIEAGLRQGYQPPARSTAQPVGFAVVAYTPQQATVETLAGDGSQYAAGYRTVEWAGGDWKLVMLPGGTAGPGPQLLTGAAGFARWGGGHA